MLRLMGWDKNAIIKKHIQIAPTGAIPPDQAESHLHSIDLYEWLNEVYRQALEDYENDIPDNPSEDQIENALDAHGPRILEAEELVEKAHKYLIDITDELASPDTLLRIDQEMIIKTGKTYITIRSLDEWAEKNNRNETASSTGKENPQTESSSLSGNDSLPDENKKANRSLYVTLALAIDKLAKEKGPKYFQNGKPNVKSVSELLEQAGRGMTNTGDTPLHGQSAASIKNRITHSLEQLRLIDRR